MPHVDFSIVNEEGTVSIVRNKTVGQKKTIVANQSIKVQCFDSDQIDRIFHYQELQTTKTDDKKESIIKRLFHF